MAKTYCLGRRTGPMLRCGGGRWMVEALAYRIPRPVTEMRKLSNCGGYPVCPTCHRTMEREYQAYCDRCGQRLSWDAVSEAQEDTIEE